MSASISAVILIVEDDHGLGSLMQKHLSRAGFIAIIATSGAQAIEMLGQRAVDLMVLDFGLPDMTGTQLIDALADQNLVIPFIVVTGRGDQHLAVEMMKRGARDYLVKDASLLDLLPSVVTQTCHQLERDHRLAEAEQRIREQNRFLENILNSLSHPLYVIDAETYDIQMANNAAQASERTAFASQSAETGRQSTLTTAAGKNNSPIEDVKRTGRPLIFEHVHYGSSGQASIHEIHVYPVFDEQGRVKQVIEYDLDVTTRKTAEQALRESEARLRQVIESLPIVLVSHEPTGRPTLMLGAVEEILGHDVEYFRKDPWNLAQIVCPNQLDSVLNQTCENIRTGHPFEMDLCIIHGKDRRSVWLHAQVVPIYDEENTLIRVDSLLVDKTNERRMTEERKQIEAHLQQTQKLESLGILAGGIAHDFNNLLTIITGNAQFLRESASFTQAEDKALADIETASASATEMTRSLQAFSRPSKPQFAILDANILTRDVYRLLRRLIPVRVEFDLRVDPSPCLIAADPAQMQQVLINLCVNARDALNGQGHIKLSTRRVAASELPSRLGADTQSNYIEVNVTDNGCGMTAETLRLAFDPFFTTKTKDQGTGLGLTIVYSIVQSHDGFIDVQSEPDKGTEFRLYFAEAQPAPAEKPAVAPVRGTERILVVDDEQMIASLIQTLLESSGYKVCVAHRPEEALELAQRPGDPIELAVVDLQLPGMTGDKCLAALREKWPNLKALLVTGHEVDEAALSLQNVQILQKPFSSQSIMKAVRQALDEPAMK